MTSIEKLLIQGIRSFDPKDGSVIDFYTPLTLIVGQNGAGKTTVIECLKYISTGEMPPNCSNGQAFIHDTRIANESEVKAQIKLRFKNPNGKPIVATRSLSLIQKAGNKQEYRQIDSSLQSYNADGQKVSKSFRCSDLDKEIPELMGVAKPILKHVIFCHQEESNWPLSESAKLKVKFDEIFSAVRYTKALKSIKDKRKELAQQIKEYKLKLEVVSTNKDHAHRIKNEMTRMEAQLKRDNEELEKIKYEMVERKREIERVQGLQEKVTQVASEASLLEARLREMQRQRDTQLQTLTEPMSETDDELVAMSSAFDDELKSMLSAEGELTENLMRLSGEKQKLSARSNDLRGEAVRLQVLKEQNEGLVKERDREMAEFVTRYRMKAYAETGGYSREEVERFLKEIGDKLKLLSQAIDAEQKSGAVGKIQQDFNDLKVKKHQLEVQLSQLNSTISANNSKISSLESEISGYLSSSEKLEKFDQEIKALEEDIQNKEREMQASQYHKRVDELTASIKEKQTESKKLNDQLKMLIQCTVRLNMLKSNLEDALKLIDSKISPVLDKINVLFGSDEWTIDNLDSQVAERASKKSKELTEKVASNQAQRKDVIVICRNKMSFIEQGLVTKEAEFGKLNDGRLLERFGSLEEMDKVLKSRQDALDQLQRSAITLESEEVVYKDYMEKANLTHKCSLCQTSMATEKELEDFVHHLSTHCENIPEKLQTLRAQIGEFSKEIEALTSQRSPLTRLLQLQKELGDAKSEIEVLSKDLEQTVSIDEEETKEINKLKLEFGEIQSVQMVSRVIDQLVNNKKKISEEIAREQANIENKVVKMTTAELETVIQQLESSVQEESAQLEQVSVASKSAQADLYSVKSKLMESKNELSKISNASGIVQRLGESKIELQREAETSKVKVTETLAEIEETQKSMEAKNTLYLTEKEKYENKMATLQKERNLFQVRIDSIQAAHRRIAGYSGDEVYQRVQEQLKELADATQLVESDYKVGETSLTEIRNNLAQTDTMKRSISDNIVYRQHLSNIEQVMKQLERKQEIVKSMGGNEEIRNLQESRKDFESLKSKYDLITGQTNFTSAQITSLSKECSKPGYSNIDDSYKDLFLKLQASDIVYHDLDKYYKALDKALMKYHTLKMDEINKSIREIWQTTYKGTDIDTIEIRSEESKTANKTVNYRVVMLKGDIEMDMRGRCSAGQKVLACLVIRMALAENFCANCGILALDEPTSHLDRSNIESFANSLLNIIESRKNQKGFQLIIITHDEEFVQYLSRGNFCDYYWKVKKNAQQHSTLEKKAISDL